MTERTQQPQPSSSHEDDALRPMLRIGELSRRVRVRPETLRAWERRYRLFEPGRTGGNYRLYSALDEGRARAMTRLLARGVSTAEAAKLAREHPRLAVRTGPGAAEAGPEPIVHPAAVANAPEQAGAGTPEPAPAASPALADARNRLIAAIKAFDDGEATAVIDESVAALSVDSVLADVVLPVLRRIGDQWSCGDVSVAQEHFGSELLRGRLLGLARRWGAGTGPLALLACPPGERHDLGLLAFGLALRERGWRIAYLGADTPLETLDLAANHLEPALVVVAATERDRFDDVAGELRPLADNHPLLVGGAAADAEVARELGAAYRGADAIEVARTIAADVDPVISA